MLITDESKEMYLETIYELSLIQEHVKAVDIVNKMGYSKPSVSNAMKKLLETEYIEVNNFNITLTEKGLSLAKKVYEKHTTLTDVFEGFGMPKEMAEENACRVEHVISDEAFEYIKNKSNN